MRPDRAVIVYTSRIKQAFKGIPVILGGIEASLRRLAHYDYWSDKVRRSVLLDAKADMIVYGMGKMQYVSWQSSLLRVKRSLILRMYRELYTGEEFRKKILIRKIV